jgi:hypothetical protein
MIGMDVELPPRRPRALDNRCFVAQRMAGLAFRDLPHPSLWLWLWRVGPRLFAGLLCVWKERRASSTTGWGAKSEAPVLRVENSNETMLGAGAS